MQARVEIDDFVRLKTILGVPEDQNIDFAERYEMNDKTLVKIVDEYRVSFDPAPLEEHHVFLHRPHFIDRAPYRVHTNYELFLLLDGRKKLARMGDSFPPMQFPGEERFDHWVEQGLLHREEVIDLWDKPIKDWLGLRTVYYTLKGEEWRISAMKLICNAASKSGGWNEYYERLEGMLFGYEDWQNDWWIGQRRNRSRPF